LQDIGGRWNGIRKFGGLWKLLILKIIGYKFSATVPLIELSVGQLGRSQGGTDELIDLFLVWWNHKKFTKRIINYFELPLILDHMLEHELLLGCVLGVASRNVFAEVKSNASRFLGWLLIINGFWIFEFNDLVL
jgi:hypothetical protein